jgi:hypothetical protein
MDTLKNWKAKRAGGRITIYGQNESGQPARVVGVDVIDAPNINANGHANPVATDKDGRRYALA